MGLPRGFHRAAHLPPQVWHTHRAGHRQPMGAARGRQRHGDIHPQGVCPHRFCSRHPAQPLQPFPHGTARGCHEPRGMWGEAGHQANQGGMDALHG